MGCGVWMEKKEEKGVLGLMWKSSKEEFLVALWRITMCVRKRDGENRECICVGERGRGGGEGDGKGETATWHEMVGHRDTHV